MKPNAFLQILNGLKPATYALTNDFEEQGLIAYNDTEIKLLDLFSEHNKEPKVFEFKSEKIANIISQHFEDKDDSFLLTTTNKNSTFTTYLCDFKLKEKTELFKSISTPMIIAHPLTLKPLIVFAYENKLKFCEIDKDGHKIESFDNVLRLPSGIHSSSFIDVTGDMHSELVLHTKEDNKNFIDIYKLTSPSKLEKVKSIDLQDGEIGPILFSEITNSLAPDMVYVSSENGHFYLNLWKNVSIDHLSNDFPKNLKDFKERISSAPSNEIFNKNIIKLDLADALSDYKPVFQNKDGLPSGIFLADLSGNGVKDVFLTVEAPDKSLQKVIAFVFDHEEKTFKPHETCNINQSPGFGYIHSVSVCDYNDSGSQNLIITAYETGTDTLVSIPYEFESVSQEPGISFLTLVALPNKKKFYIPGTVIAMLYENEEKFCKTSLSPQTSFMSLQPLKVFVGLGPTNLFIDWATIKVPSYDEKINRKDAISFLVPNTFSVFTLHGENWRVQSFFSKLYFNITVYALVAIVIVFMTIFVILSIQEKRKYKRVMNKDSARIVFNAL